MPERFGSRRVGAVACALLAIVLVVSGSPARAAEIDWAGSKFDAPTLGEFTNNGKRGKATVTTKQFEIRGTFLREQGNPAAPYTIQNVRASFDRKRAEGDTSPRDPSDPCLPADLATTDGESSTAGSRSRRTFRIPASHSSWPCNGRFTVTATATATSSANPQPETYSLVAELTIAVRPAPVTSVDVVVDDDAAEATVTFEKLAAEAVAPDALPYRVQRAGPADADGDYGLFEQVGEPIPLDGEPTYVDSVDEPGAYRYRVLSVRNGADGPIFAKGEDTAVAEATVAPDPAKPTTTTTTAPTSTTTQPETRVGGGRTIPTLPRRPPVQLPAPPTTVDPGFDPELDYDGSAPLPDLDESPELAGEDGLSVIQTEDDGAGAGLVAPVAGGLVLLAWAGHGVYLNRLAKQF